MAVKAARFLEHPNVPNQMSKIIYVYGAKHDDDIKFIMYIYLCPRALDILSQRI